MRASTRSALAATIAVVSLLVVEAAPAFATGGSSIAGATPIVVGQQEFGNTATDGGAPCNSPYDPDNGGSWWSLSVVAGDTITLDYEGDLGGVLIYPIGTSDYNVTSTNPDNSRIGSNDKQEYTFTEGRSGSVPMDFAMSDSCFNLDPSSNGIQPGPFDFTTRVKHGVVLSVPTVASLRFSGELNVTTSSPAGSPLSDPALAVSLQIQPSGQPWSTIGTASPSDGTAAVAYQITPALAGKMVKLRAVAAGAAYTTGISSVQRVELPKAPPVCRTPRLHGLTLASAKRALLRAHCSLGKLYRPQRVRRHHTLRVASQNPRAGTTHPADYKVTVRLR